MAACTSQPDISGADPLAAEQRAAELPPPDVAGMRRVLGISTPFPDGDWSFVGEVTSKGSTAYPQRSAVWATHAAGVIDRLMVVWEQAGQPGIRASFEHCSDGDYPHAVVLRNGRDGHACWHIRPVSLGLAGDAPPQNRLIASYAERNDLVISPSMIGVRYVLANGSTRRSIEYLYNPDLLAPAAGARLWQPDDWTRTAVMADPHRRAVVAALGEWGARWSSVALPHPADGT